MIRRLFERKPRKLPEIPPGRRIYAIGDVHGRLDLLDALLARVQADTGARGAADTEVILLGDLIDRGPDSAGVVARVMAATSWARFIVLKGNHEDAMLAALDGDRDMCRMWLQNGGPAALASWGVADDVIAEGSLGAVTDAACDAIPARQRAFLERAPHSCASETIISFMPAFVPASASTSRLSTTRCGSAASSSTARCIMARWSCTAIR